MRDKILKILQEAVPGTDFEKASNLIDEKIINSLSLVQIVSDLSEEFDITFSMSELIPEKFNSLEAIISTVRAKLL